MPEIPEPEPSEAELRSEIKSVCWGRFLNEKEFDELLDAFAARAVEAAVAKDRARCRVMLDPDCTEYCRWDEIAEAIESGREAP